MSRAPVLLALPVALLLLEARAGAQLNDPWVTFTKQPAQLALSGVNLGITKLRGQWQTWRGIRLMPTFHPAYLLRNPPAKKEFWQDLKAVMATIVTRAVAFVPPENAITLNVSPGLSESINAVARRCA